MKKKIIILIITPIALLVLYIIILQAKKYLFRKKITNIALREYDKFGKGVFKESEKPMQEYIAEYWNKGLQMPSQSPTGVPWSAAFISYVMRMAGAGNKFRYSARHSTYIRWAIENLKNNKGYFKAYQPKTKPLQVGDMVCYARQSGVNYDTGTDYDSHCDIITSISKRNGTAIGIGGNVSNSVSATTYNINKEGYITSPKIFAVIKPNINAWL